MVFSRRPGARFNRGRISSALAGGNPPAPAWTPADITSVTVNFWLRSDAGVTIATGVSQWLDQSPAARTFAQATAGAQAAFTASDATLGGLPTIGFDGSDDFIQVAAWAPNVPGTTPVWFWAILKQNVWTLNRNIWGAAANRLLLQQNAATPDLRMFNGAGANINAGGTAGSWVRVIESFTGSTSDSLKAGSASASTGVTSGNSAITADTFALGAVGTAVGTAASFANVSFAEVLCTQGAPTELADLEAYGAARYPTAVF